MNDNPLSCRQLLTNLQPGQHVVMCSPREPQKVITQAHRLGEVYYLVGPQFYDALPALELKPYFQAAADAGDTPATAVALLNGALADCAQPPEARVFTCTGLSDALHTLAGLFASYR